MSKTLKKFWELFDKGYPAEKAMRIAQGKEVEKGTLKDAVKKAKDGRNKKRNKPIS